MQHMSKNNNRGFTIPELLVTITVATIILAGVFALLVNLIRIGNSIIETTRQVQNNQLAIQSIEDDLQLTRGFLKLPDIVDTPISGSGTWSHVGSGVNNRVLILQTGATTAHKSNATRELVHKLAGGCPVGTQPATNNIIYYVTNRTLYRRIVVENLPASTYCPGQSISQVRTCVAPATPANCREKDVIVATDITGFSIDYFTNPGDTTPVADAYTSGSLQSRLAVQITITSTKNIDGEQHAQTTAIRLSRVSTN
ncbi:prepilin-type N-terminal cleavage/methylation domain-containing protein [Candidatus Saccharibacteria bacterium]|nr:prepilin-type N-terminal cleavage/methylation domain-containing protein [Candidatus Saccharibacteria bacterium]